MAGDPTEDLPKWREPRHEARALTRAEEVTLLEACRQEYKVEGIIGKRNVESRKGGATKQAGESWPLTCTPPPWLHPFVLIELRTALRLETLLRLQWRHVNLEKRTIHFSAEQTKNKAALSIPPASRRGAAPLAAQGSTEAQIRIQNPLPCRHRIDRPGSARRSRAAWRGFSAAWWRRRS